MRHSLAPRLLAVAVLLVLVGGPVPATGAQTAPQRGDGPRADLVRAVAVLHGWDARREAAWRAADRHALRALYTPASRAGAADLRLLRAYAARGLVVQRIETQVFSVEVLRAGRAGLRLRVLDRVAGGELSDGHRTSRLGTTAPVVRTIELVRVPGRDVWQVREVSARG